MLHHYSWQVHVSGRAARNLRLHCLVHHLGNTGMEIREIRGNTGTDGTFSMLYRG